MENTQQTPKVKAFYVQETPNTVDFNTDRFDTWEEALQQLNNFITEKSMSIFYLLNGALVKEYRFKQRSATAA